MKMRNALSLLIGRGIRGDEETRANQRLPAELNYTGECRACGTELGQVSSDHGQNDAAELEIAEV